MEINGIGFYTSVMGKFKKQKPVRESQRADHPMWQKKQK